MRKKEIRKPSFYLVLLLLFILADIICDNYVFRTFNSRPPDEEFYLFLGLLTLQIFASPIQAGFSDLYCRKKSLVVALSFSLGAIVLVFVYNLKIVFNFSMLALISVVKGCFGNTIPLAWAGIGDTQDKNFRFSFGLSTGAYAVGYLLLIANVFLTEIQSNVTIIVFLALLVYLCVTRFQDIRDKKSVQIYKKKVPFGIRKLLSVLGLVWNESKQVIKSLTAKHIRNALGAFLLWEISLYSILLLYVDFKVKDFSIVAVGMMVGYLLGVLILKYTAWIKDDRMIKIGYYFSTLSLIPSFILFPFVEEINFILLTVCYFFHTMGNAFLCPTLFAILAKEMEPHEQGKVYGLIESADTVAFLFASVAVMIYNYFHLHLIFIIGFSFITVAVSWFPYEKFKKTKPVYARR